MHPIIYVYIYHHYKVAAAHHDRRSISRRSCVVAVVAGALVSNAVRDARCLVAKDARCLVNWYRYSSSALTASLEPAQRRALLAGGHVRSLQLAQRRTCLGYLGTFLYASSDLADRPRRSRQRQPCHRRRRPAWNADDEQHAQDGGGGSSSSWRSHDEVGCVYVYKR
jgi:hypothetical protein